MPGCVRPGCAPPHPRPARTHATPSPPGRTADRVCVYFRESRTPLAGIALIIFLSSLYLRNKSCISDGMFSKVVLSTLPNCTAFRAWDVSLTAHFPKNAQHASTAHWAMLQPRPHLHPDAVCQQAAATAASVRCLAKLRRPGARTPGSAAPVSAWSERGVQAQNPSASRLQALRGDAAAGVVWRMCVCPRARRDPGPRRRPQVAMHAGNAWHVQHATSSPRTPVWVGGEGAGALLHTAQGRGWVVRLQEKAPRTLTHLRRKPAAPASERAVEGSQGCCRGGGRPDAPAPTSWPYGSPDRLQPVRQHRVTRTNECVASREGCCG